MLRRLRGSEILILRCSKAKAKWRTKQKTSINKVFGLFFVNPGFVHLSAKLRFRSVTNTGVSAIGYTKELLSISVNVRSFVALSKCLVSRHRLKSITDNQNWHDILKSITWHTNKWKKTEKTRIAQRRKMQNAQFQAQTIFSCSHDRFTTWVLTSVCWCFWWRP